MECQGLEAPDIHTATNANESTSETAPALGGIADVSRECHEISVPSSTGQEGDLAAPSGSQIRRHLDPPPQFVRADMLGIDGHIVETTQPQCQQTGTDTGLDGGIGTEGQRTWRRETSGPQDNTVLTAAQRHDVRRALSSLTLCNRSTFCFANSAWITMMWALVSRETFTFDDWGHTSALFSDMLRRHLTQPLDLALQPWFQALLLTWPADEGEGQADCAEFAQLLLSWVASHSISCAWERRLMQGSKVCTVDRGASWTPLTLQIDPELCVDGVLPLSSLLRSWHLEHGMSQALTSAAALVCLHVDRFCKTGQGDLVKDFTPLGVHWGVSLPCFVDSTMQVTWVDYQVVAMSAHAGDHTSGHYTSMLKVSPPPLEAGPPYQWLFVNDNQVMRPCWYDPPVFPETITLIWLSRVTELELHEYHRDQGTPPDVLDLPISQGQLDADRRAQDMLGLLTMKSDE
eukprot:s103_g48.t1